MADYIADYANYLELERHSSDNTISSYVRDVTQFAGYLAEEEDSDLLHCKEEQIERIVKRNGVKNADEFREKWIPLEEMYFSEFDVEGRCEMRFRT